LICTAQIKDNPYSIFVNGGTSFTKWDFNPELTFWGECGVKYKVKGGLSLGLSLNNHHFKKYWNDTDYIRTFYTRLISMDLMALYELRLFKNTYLGVGGAFSYVVIGGSAKDETYSESGKILYYNEIFNYYHSEAVFDYKAIVNLRTKLYKHLDIQAGAYYHDFQYSDLDFFATKEKDIFYDVYLGLVYNFGDGLIEKKSNKVGCPRF